MQGRGGEGGGLEEKNQAMPKALKGFSLRGRGREIDRAKRTLASSPYQLLLV